MVCAFTFDEEDLSFHPATRGVDVFGWVPLADTEILARLFNKGFSFAIMTVLGGVTTLYLKEP